MEVREFLESLGMDLKKPIAQDIYDGQGIILGEYERFLESQTSMAATMSLAEVYANCNNAYDEMNNDRKIKLLKKSIKHCRNPLEKKGLEKQLNKAYLEINTLLLGCSTKTDNSDTVGQFGEGYKIAALVLNRIGKTFTVYNNSKNEIWISSFEKSKVFGEPVLTFKIFDNITENEGLIIEIENVESEEYKKLFNVWLDMPGSEQHEKIETTYGWIFTDKDMQGKVFVNGLAIESKSDKHFGYNFKPKYITLERDRKSCNSWDMSRVTADMICEALNSGTLNIKEVIKIAKEGRFSDINNLQYKTWDSNVQKIGQMFVDEFDEEYSDAIPVSCQSDFDHVKEMGGKPVIVPYEIAQIVSDITKERIDKLAENIWGSGFTTKEKLQQWRDFYKDEISEEAIRHFNQIIEELN